VIETFCGLRPLTDEATSDAMPRTADGSRPVEAPLSRTAAVAGDCSSEKSWSSGSTSETCAPATPCTWPMVDAIWPSRARWYVTFCWKSEAPSFCLSKSSKPGWPLPGRPFSASATRACGIWPLTTASAVPLFCSS
jgi:hypothetical protein